MKHAIRPLLAILLLLVLGSAVQAQPYTIRFRAANLLEDVPYLDLHFDDMASPTFQGIPQDSISKQREFKNLPSASLNVKVVAGGAGLGSPLFNRDLVLKNQTEYTAIAYGKGGNSRLKMLERGFLQNPQANRALFRILNGVSATSGNAFDFYLDSTSSDPLFMGVMRDSATPFKNVFGNPQTLIITRTGDKTPVGRLVAPLFTGGRTTLVITGSDADNLRVYAIDEVQTDAYRIPLLKGASGGLLPSLRVMHVWPVMNLSGKGKQALDVYIDQQTPARAPNLQYRTASEKFGPFTGETVQVKFVRHDEGGTDPVLVENVLTHLDSDYVVILTQFKNGTSVGLTLATPNSSPISLEDSTQVRVAMATDYYPGVTIRIIANNTDTLRVAPPFLTATSFVKLPRGELKVNAYRAGEIAPFFTSTSPGNFSNPYFTYVVSGDDSTFNIDLLDDVSPIRQVFDATSSAPADPLLAASYLQLRSTPNPSYGSSHISFRLPSAGYVRLEMFDPLGRRVATLLDDRRDAGEVNVVVDGADLPAGAYTYRLRTESGEQANGRMVIVR